MTHRTPFSHHTLQTLRCRRGPHRPAPDADIGSTDLDGPGRGFLLSASGPGRLLNRAGHDQLWAVVRPGTGEHRGGRGFVRPRRAGRAVASRSPSGPRGCVPAASSPPFVPAGRSGRESGGGAVSRSAFAPGRPPRRRWRGRAARPRPPEGGAGLGRADRRPSTAAVRFRSGSGGVPHRGGVSGRGRTKSGEPVLRARGDAEVRRDSVRYFLFPVLRLPASSKQAAHYHLPHIAGRPRTGIP